ncbi:unnamed protein product, partial [Nesidiocoris tenuis]
MKSTNDYHQRPPMADDSGKVTIIVRRVGGSVRAMCRPDPRMGSPPPDREEGSPCNCTRRRALAALNRSVSDPRRQRRSGSGRSAEDALQ